jgi:hypothetical protein
MVGDRLAAATLSVLKKMEELEGLTEECRIVASLRASSMWKGNGRGRTRDWSTSWELCYNFFDSP